MRIDGNHGGTLGYEPNDQGEWAEQPEYREPPLSLAGAAQFGLAGVERFASLATHPDHLVWLRRNASADRVMRSGRGHLVHRVVRVDRNELQHEVVLKIRYHGKQCHVVLLSVAGSGRALGLVSIAVGLDPGVVVRVVADLSR